MQNLKNCSRGYPEFGHFNELISKEYTIAYDLVKGRVKKKFLGVIDWGTNRERGIAYFEKLVFNLMIIEF